MGWFGCLGQVGGSSLRAGSAGTEGELYIAVFHCPVATGGKFYSGYLKRDTRQTKSVFFREIKAL